MKKLLYLIGLGAILPSVCLASLWGFYNERGEVLPPVSERVILANSCGITNYTGTAEQNIKLESCLRGTGLIGVTIPTIVALYEDTLAQKLSSTATSTFTLVRGTDKQSRSLSGTFGFIIDEGTSVEEFLTATCAGTTCTIITRGLDVINGTSNVAANQYEHRRGAIVKITDYPQLTVLSRILNGDEALPNGLYWYSTTTAGLRYSGGNLQWTVDGFTNSYNFTSSSVSQLTASSTRGIGVTDSKVHINASSTTGMAFDTDGKLYQMTSSTKGILSDSNGVYLDTTQARNWTGEHTFTVTTTLATTTVTTLNTTAINIGGTSTAPLVNGAVTTLHTHDDTACKVGFGTRLKNLGSGTATYTTGIDANYITFQAAWAGTGPDAVSFGTYDVPGDTSGVFAIDETGAFYATSSAAVIYVDLDGTVTTAAVTATSTTGFTLTWALTPNAETAINFMWTACK